MEEVSLQQAVSDIISYNGYYDDIQKIKEHIKSFNDLKYATFPNFLPKDIDTFIRIFWSLLVLMYGDYGTSPRFGWIENKKEAIDFIDQLCESTLDS